jgi:chloramphenicol 3-O phosphotransferase
MTRRNMPRRWLACRWIGSASSPPLDVLEERERKRGDRDIGLARWLYDRVHQGIRYDLEIDTSFADPAKCAQQIRAAFGL